MISYQGSHDCAFCAHEQQTVKVRNNQPQEAEYKTLGPREFMYVVSNENSQWQSFLYHNGQKHAMTLSEAEEIDFNYAYQELATLGRQAFSENVFEDYLRLQKENKVRSEEYQIKSSLLTQINVYHQNHYGYEKRTESSASEDIRIVIDNSYIVTFPAMILHYLDPVDTKNLHGWKHPWSPEKWFVHSFLMGSKLSFPASQEELDKLPEYKVGYLAKAAEPKEFILDSRGGDAHVDALSDEKDEAKFGQLSEEEVNQLMGTLDRIIVTVRAHDHRKDSKPVAIQLPNSGLIKEDREQPNPKKSHLNIVALVKNNREKLKKLEVKKSGR